MKSKRKDLGGFQILCEAPVPSAQQQLLLSEDILVSCTGQVPVSTENLVSQGRVIKTHHDIKAGLHSADKACLLLQSDVLQRGRSVNSVYCSANTVFLLMQLCGLC